MKFGVLGPLEVTDPSGNRQLGGPKQRTVLALLLANLGQHTSTDRLVEGVYGDEPPDGARRSIQTYISNLRAELGECLRGESSGYVLDVDRAAVDSARFEDLVEAARDLESNDPRAASDLLRQALDLWRGHPYDGVDGRAAIDIEIARLGELRLSAKEARIDADLALGKHAELVAELDGLTTEHPLRERFRAQHMLALYRSGRQAEALDVYRRIREQLVEELGIEPSKALQTLELQILNQDESLDLARRPSIGRKALLVVDVDPGSLAATLGSEQRNRYLADLDTVTRDAVEAWNGEVFSERATSSFAAFRDVSTALHAAEAIARNMPTVGRQGTSRRLGSMAVDVGDVEAGSDGDWTGPVVSRAAGLAGAAHGGQVLLSSDAHADAISDTEAPRTLRGLGHHQIARLDRDEPVFQLIIDGLAFDFPPLRIDAVPPPLPGRTSGIAGYELREELGRGMFGVVYRAYQPSVGREVAIKAIHSDWASDPDFIRRFELEAQLIARLEHPNIVPVYDYWRDPEGAYLVMRWIRGGSLSDVLVRRPLTLHEAGRLVDHIGAALSAAHLVGLTHQDIKPSNVLVGDDGYYYLSDFGIATTRSSSQGPPADIADLAQLVQQALAGGEDVPAAVDAVVTRALPGDVYHDVATFIADWHGAAGKRGAAEDDAPRRRTRNPYKGLNAFTEVDAIDFHGRTELVADMVVALRDRRLVAAVGPSGVGKSSAVRAGLIPALHDGAIPGSEEWLVSDMSPGRYPFEAFASALLRVATTAMPGLDEDLVSDRRGMVRATQRLLPEGAQVVILIDQFEELFTISDEAACAAFLDSLITLVTDPDSNTRVVLTLRADFFDRPLRHADFASVLRAGTVLVASPTAEEARSMIELPAAGVGVGFEAGLVERIMTDIADEPGVLPLLEYALTELFEGRDRQRLTLAGYEASGGVRAALGRRAEDLYQDLDPAAQEAAQSVFLRLVNVNQASQVTRRRVRQSELTRIEAKRGAVDAVFATFGDHRLLTFDRDPVTRGPTIEVSHEALFREWQSLAGWIEQERADLILQGQLRQALDEWRASGNDDAFLLAGGRLTRHEEWVANTNVPMTDAEDGFLAVSRTVEDARTRTRRARRRLTMTGFAAAAIVAVVLAGVAYLQQREAVQERRLATSRELALQSVQQLEIDPERSMLLAREAIDVGREGGHEVPEAVAALHRAIQGHRITSRLPGGGFVAVSPDGDTVATAHEPGGVALWDVETGAPGEVLERDATVLGTAFSPDGGRLAVLYGGVAPPVWIWDLATGNRIELDGPPNPDEFPPHNLSFSNDGRLLAAYLDGANRIWDTRTGASVYDVQVFGEAVFSPTSATLAVADNTANTISIRDAATGDETGIVVATSFAPQAFSFSPDGTRLAVVSGEESAFAVYDATLGTEVARATVARPNGQPAWFPDGRRVLVGGDAGIPRVFDAETGDPLVELYGHQGVTWALATTSDGDAVTAGLDDASTIVWNPEVGLLPEVDKLETGVPRFRTFAYAGTADTLFVSGRGEAELPGTVMLIDATTAEPVLVLEGQTVGFPPEAHPIAEGRAIATAGPNGASTIVTADTGETLYTAPSELFVVEMTAAGDRALVATAPFGLHSGEPEAMIVDVASGAAVSELDEPEIASASFSDDNRLVWTWAGADIAFYDTANGQESFRLDVWNAAFMPDGETLAVIDASGVLHLADLGMLEAGSSLEEASRWQSRAHDSFTPILRAHPDGTFIVSAGFDEPVKVWNADDGSLLTELESGLTSGSARARFHPSRPHVTLLSDGGTLLTFTLDTDELIEIAETRLTRDLTDAECVTYLHLESCADR